MNNPVLIKINWLYHSLKEQYRFINSLFKCLTGDPALKDAVEREFYYYKTSLVLFKKSMALYTESLNANYFTKVRIENIKELYLRRCLINLNKSFELFAYESDGRIKANPLIQDIVGKISVLIGSVKELGRSLECVL